MQKRILIAAPLLIMTAVAAKGQEPDTITRDTVMVVREIRTENNVKDTSYMVSKVKKGYDAIENGVVKGYKSIENGVVNGYSKFQGGVVAGWQKFEDRCVEVLFGREGESVEQTRARLNANKEKHNR